MTNFNLQSTDGAARAGSLRTPHGEVPTPAFLPVATQGSVKALDPADLVGVGATIVLSNTYHLYLRPGVDVVKDLGGLHAFMGWDGPVLTDSGGFQGYSLERLTKITDEGIRFTSHIDGSVHDFTPEVAVRHQEALGADVIMTLDVCLPAPSERSDVRGAVKQTSRWAARCMAARRRQDQQLFGIVQGGLDPDLRRRSAEEITSLGFDGYAIGGLSVGESKAEMYEIAGFSADLLPAGAPRYLMGVGSPEDLVECVGRGIDMFDCALPTRGARNGSLFVPEGRVNIRSSRFRGADRPVQEGCDCYTCEHFSTAYLHHLFKAKELLAYRLATLHNLRFVLRLMEEMRRAIGAGRFGSYRTAFLDRWVPTDEEVRRQQKSKWLASAAQRGRGLPTAAHGEDAEARSRA